MRNANKRETKKTLETQWMQNSILNLLVNKEKEWVAITSDNTMKWTNDNFNEHREEKIS